MRMHFFACTVAFCTPLIASAAGITDYSSRPPKTVTLPAAGGSYIDPVFGTKIIRVTDSRYGTLCTHAYSYWPAFNHDNNRLMLACDNSILLFKFDPLTDKVTADGTLRGTDGYKVQFDGAVWSYSSPDIMFAVDQTGFRIWKIDVSKRGAAGMTVLKDFTGKFPSTTYITQLTTDTAGRVFSFHTRDRVTGAHLQPAVWDRTTNLTYVFPKKTGYTLDESKVDKAGKYAMINYDDRTTVLWDFRAGTTNWFYPDSANDDVGGHFDVGLDFIVNSDIYHAGIVGRTFSDLRPPDRLVKYLRPNGSENWTLCDHVSLRTTNEEFFAGSTYMGDGTYAAFEKEIFIGFLDGHGFVRLAHTRSKGNVDYWSQPRATVDMKGRYIVYTSDLGQASRTDVMIVKIPSQYWP